MKTNLQSLLAGLATLTLLGACGDSEGTGGGGSATTSNTVTSTTSASSMTTTTTTTSTGTGGSIPMPPTLGATQIDRMGRPAINTATNDTFLVPSASPPGFKASDDITRAAAEDDYNEESDSTTWVTKFAPTIALNLGVLDSLDGNCENQIASCKNDQMAGGCYNTLAGVLADDRLWVKTTSTSCGAYLGVEADAVLAANMDCGGRRPIDDVIKVTYSVLAFGDTTSFDDGITAPNGLHPDTFPFFGAPH
jgi:hypothetical protein